MSIVRPVDPHDETMLRAWYAATRAGAVAGRTFPLVFGFEEVAGSLRNPGGAAKRAVFAAYEGDNLVGALKLDFPMRENRDVAEWTLNVPPGHRGRGYGAALFAYGLTVSANEGRSKHLAEIDVPLEVGIEAHPGSRFARAHGFASLHTEERLVLQLPMSDERLAGLRDAAAGHHRDYEFVSWTDVCPDEYTEAFVDMRNVMERDVPTGELDHEPRVWDVERLRESEQRLAANGLTALITAARHRDGRFAGYSLMFVPASNPDEVYQDDTLVVSSHRGHRLGAALKVRNLERLRQRFGNRLRVHTWTDPDNTPMRAINHDFGFETVEVMHEFERVDSPPV